MLGHYVFEMTDTFGGEANYSWVRRAWADRANEFKEKPLTRIQMVRIAKAWAGIKGVKCEVEELPDGYAIRPQGISRVIFATFSDSSGVGRGEYLGAK